MKSSEEPRAKRFAEAMKDIDAKKQKKIRKRSQVMMNPCENASLIDKL